jgi:excisionase family DNA binding protein
MRTPPEPFQASYLPLKRAAAEVGLSRSTLLRRIADGSLRATKFGGLVMLDMRALRARLAEAPEVGLKRQPGPAR